MSEVRQVASANLTKLHPSKPLSVHLEQALASDDPPSTREEWQALAEKMLTPQACVFVRNLEISSLYAQLYQRHPNLYKWAGMAAFASYHVRIALWPMKLRSHAGYVDLDRVREKARFSLDDIDLVRRTNNAIFEDIFWAHLVYDGSESGLKQLRAILADSDRDQSLLRGFEEIERARRAGLQGDSVEAQEAVWRGNVALLEHEQREVVQQHFERMTCRFARLFSIGSTLDFEAQSPGEKIRYLTSFYVFMWTRGLPQVLRSWSLPRVTRLVDRWNWILRSIVPRFRRFESSPDRIHSHLEIVKQSLLSGVSCTLPESSIRKEP